MVSWAAALSGIQLSRTIKRACRLNRVNFAFLEVEGFSDFILKQGDKQWRGSGFDVKELLF